MTDTTDFERSIRERRRLGQRVETLEAGGGGGGGDGLKEQAIYEALSVHEYGLPGFWQDPDWENQDSVFGGSTLSRNATDAAPVACLASGSYFMYSIWLPRGVAKQVGYVGVDAPTNQTHLWFGLNGQDISIPGSEWDPLNRWPLLGVTEDAEDAFGTISNIAIVDFVDPVAISEAGIYFIGAGCVADTPGTMAGKAISTGPAQGMTCNAMFGGNGMAGPADMLVAGKFDPDSAGQSTVPHLTVLYEQGSLDFS